MIISIEVLVFRYNLFTDCLKVFHVMALLQARITTEIEEVNGDISKIIMINFILIGMISLEFIHLPSTNTYQLCNNYILRKNHEDC